MCSSSPPSVLDSGLRALVAACADVSSAVRDVSESLGSSSPTRPGQSVAPGTVRGAAARLFDTTSTPDVERGRASFDGGVDDVVNRLDVSFYVFTKLRWGGGLVIKPHRSVVAWPEVEDDSNCVRPVRCEAKGRCSALLLALHGGAIREACGALLEVSPKRRHGATIEQRIGTRRTSAARQIRMPEVLRVGVGHPSR